MVLFGLCCGVDSVLFMRFTCITVLVFIYKLKLFQVTERLPLEKYLLSLLTSLPYVLSSLYLRIMPYALTDILGRCAVEKKVG